MRILRKLGLISALTVVLGAAACTGPSGPPLPEIYGLYARNDDHLKRLDGHADWEKKTWPERSQLSPRSEFVVYDRGLAGAVPDDAVLLQRVAWVRYQVTAASESDVRRVAEWSATDLPKHRVALDFRPVEGNAEMIEARPRTELPLGLYSLKLKRPGSAVVSRFGVEWDDVDEDRMNRYKQQHCVDRYVKDDAVTYKPCGASSAHLVIEDIELSRETIEGLPVLLVSGSVRNASHSLAPVPLLHATLWGADGTELEKWTFAAQRELLAPGASAGFRTSMSPPPVTAARVAVRLKEGPATAKSR